MDATASRPSPPAARAPAKRSRPRTRRPAPGAAEVEPPGAENASEEERPRRIVTTVRQLRAQGGEFLFEDHGSWSVVARDVDMTLAKGAGYGGTMSFRGGTVRIGDFEPMTTDVDADYALDGGLVDLTRLDLRMTGFDARLTGRVDLLAWPEQVYDIHESSIDLATMKDIFFADDDFTVAGAAEFQGSWHLFDGGRDLTGRFSAPAPTLQGLSFPALDGALVWTSDRFAVTRADSDFYGGGLDFSYAMEPLGAETPALATFDARYDGIDVSALFAELGVRRVRGRRGRPAWPHAARLAGRRLQRPAGARGHLAVAPPAGTPLLSRTAPAAEGARRPYAESAFAPAETPVALPARSRDRVRLRSGRGAGRAELGGDAPDRDHVRGADRLGSGLADAVPRAQRGLAGGGSRHGGGDDGVWTTHRGDRSGRPRRDGGRHAGCLPGAAHRGPLRWGRYPRLERGLGPRVRRGRRRGRRTSTSPAGRSAARRPSCGSTGGSRSVLRRPAATRSAPVSDLAELPARHVRDAFGIDGYPIDGPLSGTIRLGGAYRQPYGSGTLRLGRGVAYGERFDRADAGLRFDGGGVWLEGLDVRKGDGRVTGAMYVRWNGTYAVDADGRGLALETAQMAERAGAPVTGALDFNVTGEGAFDDPRYALVGTIDGLAIAGASVGRVTGRLDVEGDAMQVAMEADSPSLSVSGAGRIALAGEGHAELDLRVGGTRLDPFVRALRPELGECDRRGRERHGERRRTASRPRPPERRHPGGRGRADAVRLPGRKRRSHSTGAGRARPAPRAAPPAGGGDTARIDRGRSISATSAWRWGSRAISTSRRSGGSSPTSAAPARPACRRASAARSAIPC